MLPTHATPPMQIDVTEDIIGDPLQPSRSLSNFSLGTHFNPRVYETLFATTLQPRITALARRRHEETVTGSACQDGPTVSDALKAARSLAVSDTHRSSVLKSPVKLPEVSPLASSATAWAPSKAHKRTSSITSHNGPIVDPKAVFDAAMGQLLPATPVSAAASAGVFRPNVQPLETTLETSTSQDVGSQAAISNSRFLALRRKRLRTQHLGTLLLGAPALLPEASSEIPQKESQEYPITGTFHPARSKVSSNRVWSLLDRCVEELSQPSELAPNRLEPDPFPRRGGVAANSIAARSKWQHERQMRHEQEMASDQIQQRNREARLDAFDQETRRALGPYSAGVLQDDDIEENLKGEKFVPTHSNESGGCAMQQLNNNEDDDLISDIDDDEKPLVTPSDAALSGPMSASEEKETTGLLTGALGSPRQGKRAKRMVGSTWVSPALAFSLGLGKELLSQTQPASSPCNSMPSSAESGGLSSAMAPRPSPRAMTASPRATNNIRSDGELDFDVELENFPLPIPRRLPLRVLQATKPEARLRMLRHFQAGHQQIPQGPSDGMLSAAARPHPNTLCQASSASPLALQLLQQLVPPSLDTRPTKFGSPPELTELVLSARQPPENRDCEIVRRSSHPTIPGYSDQNEKLCLRINFATQHQRAFEHIRSPVAKAKQLARIAAHTESQYKRILSRSSSDEHEDWPSETTPYGTQPIPSQPMDLQSQLRLLDSLRNHDRHPPSSRDDSSSRDQGRIGESIMVPKTNTDSNGDGFQLASKTRRALRAPAEIVAMEKHARRIRRSTGRLCSPIERNPWLLKSVASEMEHLDDDE